MNFHTLKYVSVLCCKAGNTIGSELALRVN